ncbi:hypothetical protein [Micromonospora sp. C81]|uniref:hypothetical protein n=1 Tax=Micromonospora sp. C81 TaxID=2824881 RepID=UPI001B38452B|nr:hypothetical protein [Micromonospora sp. C81]MBQ1038032.1 hypothetical protein [Micromonospora sp. C81]
MDIEETSRQLKFEWSPDGGFLHDLRSGGFDQAKADRFLKVLASLDPTDPAVMDRRIIGPIFLIPYYMLSHIQNSESLGVDTRKQRNVMYRAVELITAVIGGYPAVGDAVVP